MASQEGHAFTTVAITILVRAADANPIRWMAPGLSSLDFHGCHPIRKRHRPLSRTHRHRVDFVDQLHSLQVVEARSTDYSNRHGGCAGAAAVGQVHCVRYQRRGPNEPKLCVRERKREKERQGRDALETSSIISSLTRDDLQVDTTPGIHRGMHAAHGSPDETFLFPLGTNFSPPPVRVYHRTLFLILYLHHIIDNYTMTAPDDPLVDIPYVPRSLPSLILTHSLTLPPTTYTYMTSSRDAYGFELEQSTSTQHKVKGRSWKHRDRDHRQQAVHQRQEDQWHSLLLQRKDSTRLPERSPHGMSSWSGWSGWWAVGLFP